MSTRSNSNDSSNAQETNADRIITSLITSGVSPAQALDYYMVEVQGMPAGNWAMMRDVTERAVVRNIEFAQEVLGQ